MTEHTHEHVVSDTTTLPFINKSVTVPGGVYTLVFGILTILTILEVFFGNFFRGRDELETLKVIVLLAIAISKAVLVVLFYMHLKDDSRIFAAAVLLPLLITLLSLLYLLFVPPTGYAA
jgi:cytochrome c oxidase subunit 4